MRYKESEEVDEEQDTVLLNPELQKDMDALRTKLIKFVGNYSKCASYLKVRNAQSLKFKC